MCKKIAMITSNDAKVRWTQNLLAPYNISVTKVPASFDEIQHTDVEAVARHKAQQAFLHVNGPFLIEDSGLSVHALNGFPGALFKPVLESIEEERFIHMLADNDKRDAEVRSVVVFGNAPDTLEVFSHTFQGSVPKNLGTSTHEGMLLSRIFIPADHEKPLGELTESELHAFTRETSTHFHALGTWLKEKGVLG